MDDHIEYSKFQAIRPHYERIANFSFIDTSSPWDGHTMLYNLPRVFVWIILIIYNIQHLIKVIQYRHDTDAMISISCIFFTTFIALIKQFDMSMHKKRMLKLYETAKGKIFSPKNTHQMKILEENEKKMARLQILYSILVITACTLQAVYPLVYRARGQEVELIIYFPIDIRQSPIFEIAVLYFSGMLGFQGYVNLMLDCTVVTLYSQTRVQLTLLRDNLINLVDSYEDEGARPQKEIVQKSCAREHEKVANEAEIRRRLVQCIQHHREILGFVKEVESVTAVTVNIQFFGAAWVICMTVYRMVGINFFATEFLSMLIYLACMLCQLYMYSYYGSQMKVESEFVCQSAYCTKWLAIMPGTRRQLLTFMTVVSAKPITLSVARIVPITLQTFISVLRASYTLFTVLDKN